MVHWTQTNLAGMHRPEVQEKHRRLEVRLTLPKVTPLLSACCLPLTQAENSRPAAE